jgi:hypothetical protein
VEGASAASPNQVRDSDIGEPDFMSRTAGFAYNNKLNSLLSFTVDFKIPFTSYRVHEANLASNSIIIGTCYLLKSLPGIGQALLVFRPDKPS